MPMFAYHCREMVGLGHDDPMKYLEGIGKALWVARHHADEGGWL
jgi:hypothetical protein